MTITSCLAPDARKYFTKPKGDRSQSGRNMARLGQLGADSAKCGQNWRARQDSNLRPSAEKATSLPGPNSGRGLGESVINGGHILCTADCPHPPCFLRKKKGSACAGPLRR